MAQPRNRRGGEPEGGGRGRQRSRANPFKSTQLRQWGFICYLGGHIVSRRERTDRLRRASDGLARREPRSFPSRSWGSKRGTTSGPLPFILRSFPPPPGPVTRVVSYAAIRQKSGFAVTRLFPQISLPLPPLPSPLPSPPRGYGLLGDGTSIEA